MPLASWSMLAFSTLTNDFTHPETRYIGRDQPSNAARVTARGAGIKLSPTSGSQTIRDGLIKVIEEPSYRERACALSQLILKDARSSAAVDELHRLSGCLPHL